MGIYMSCLLITKKVLRSDENYSMNNLIGRQRNDDIWIKLGADGIWEARLAIEHNERGLNLFIDDRIQCFSGRANSEENAVKMLKRELSTFTDMMKPYP